jgi:DNA polymerase-3 subunit gamma/tau
VPVTVLSRCQRFDLRRIGSTELAGLFAQVSKQEGAEVEEGALTLIARAADGSARDGLSILDQAISQASGSGAAKVSEMQVRDMLGLADRARVFDLFDAAMKGDVKTALSLLSAQYASGASLVVVVQDLLELTHWLTRVKVAPEGADDPGLAETERTRGAAMAKGLGVATLSRAWNMLLKGLGEARTAPMPLQAVEMLLIRLAYAADLPTPADALKQLENGASVPVRSAAPAPSSPTPSPRSQLAVSTNPAPVPVAAIAAPAAAPAPATFAEVVALFEHHRSMKIATALSRNVGLVKFEVGRIDFSPDKKAPADLAGLVGKQLTEWTGRRWIVSVVNAAGEKTLYEQQLEKATSDPLVKSLLEAFPNSAIENIRRAEE